MSVKYNIPIITDTTNIEGTIYAIPIYSRNLIEFKEKSVTTSGSAVNINVNEMSYIYFENEGNIYTHYFNARNGDYLKFALLTQEQFELITNAELSNYPDQLTFLLNKYSIPVQSQEDGNRLSFDFITSGLDDGDYYIISYYEKVVTEDTSYAIRLSDNVIKATFEAGRATAKIVTYK